MTSRRDSRITFTVGLVVCLILAGVASHYASSAPDGLERVATDLGFAGTARDSATAGSPLADYDLTGVGDERLSVGLAGAFGVLVTLVVSIGLFTLLARRARRANPEGSTPRLDARAH